MNWKTWAPLLLAVVLGLVAMKVAHDMTTKSGSAPTDGQGTSVAVLNKDLPAGSAISAEDLATTTLAGGVSADAVFTNTQDLEGRVLIAGAIKGAPVLRTMLAPEGAGSGLQSLIPEGMRALSIEINEFSGVAGNLTPGSRVDVVSTFGSEGPEGMVSRTVVQNVKVQSLGMSRQGDADPNVQIRSVTLLASPRDAEAIELAAATGRPRLVLRSSADEEAVSSDGVSVAELRGRSAAKDPFGENLATTQAPEQSPALHPASNPATEQLAQPPVQVQQQRRNERQITVIRGGVESRAIVDEPVSQVVPRWMTNVGTDDLPADSQN